MTDLDLRSGHIHRGLGVVARWANIALVIPSDADHDAAVDEMFSSFSPEPTSKEIIRAINNLLADGQIRSVGMVVEATGGPMAVAYGDVEILVDGDTSLNGSDGLVKEQISGKAEVITIRSANLPKAAEAVPPFDLRRGVAPGGGLSLPVLTAAPPPTMGGTAPTAEGASSEASSVLAPLPDQGMTESSTVESPFRSVLLLDVARPEGVAPLPIAVPDGEDPSGLASSTGRVEVEGILCSRGHFNNPHATYCMVCGMAVTHLTPNRVTRPRPTLGFIVFDDGSSFGLDRSYLIGREPGSDEDQDAELLVIHDNNDTLSRTHAELRLVDWAVQLVDLGSTNGTYIWDQDNERWNQLTAGHAVELHSGETVALGRRTFVFEGVGRPN